MKEKTCCLTGHRNIPTKDILHIKNRLKSELEKLINQGVIYFGTGGALGFDTLAALTVLDLRQKYPNIKLVLVLPCKCQTLNWYKDDVQKYDWIKSQADKVTTLSENYYKGCMQARNRHLVDFSNYCICYLTKNTGGTAYTVNYAKEKELKIINIK